jgi:hypothetical protein
MMQTAGWRGGANCAVAPPSALRLPGSSDRLSSFFSVREYADVAVDEGTRDCRGRFLAHLQSGERSLVHSISKTSQPLAAEPRWMYNILLLVQLRDTRAVETWEPPERPGRARFRLDAALLLRTARPNQPVIACR